MRATLHLPTSVQAALSAATLAAGLSVSCSALGPGDASVTSIRLVDQMNRINVETERSEETVEAMLARLQPVLIARGGEDAAQARESLDAATEACQRQAQQLEQQLPRLDQEGAAFFERRRAALLDIEDPEAHSAAAVHLELDLERFLEYQASAVAALDAYDDLNLELRGILEALPRRQQPDALTEEALDLRNQAWSLQMILEDCKRAAGAFHLK